MPFSHSRPNAALLSESIYPIGKKRLEIRQRVSCPPKKRQLHYLVETWFFLPKSLQINPWSYTATQYQSSIKSYIRMGIPVWPIETLTEETQKELDLLGECRRHLDSLLEQNTEGARERYEYSLKRFCLAFRVSLRSRIHDVLEIEESSAQFAAATEVAHAAVKAVRHFRRLAQKDALIRHVMRVPTFLYCDEYIAIIITRELGRLIRRSRLQSGGTSLLMAHYAAQRFYRRTRYPDSMPMEHGDNELPLFRWSILKKYIDMPLFLQVQRPSGKSLLVHTLYSLAAAVAMSCAFMLTVFLTKDNAVFSTPVFITVVVAYMLRERIKDIFNGTLFRWFRRWIPDRLLHICTGYGRKLGWCAESLQFASWDRLPRNVQKLRNRNHFIDILNAFNSEDILYYSKEIRIRRLPDLFHEPSPILMDIMRFDLSDFLRHADDVIDEPQGYLDELPVRGEKIYHVDMIRRMTGCGTSLERFRVVLTPAGIRRIDIIEPLTPNQETHDKGGIDCPFPESPAQRGESSECVKM